MPREKKHYLNRYATPAPFEHELVRPFAGILLDDSSTLVDQLKAALEFTTLVRSWENRHRAHFESRMVQRLTCVNALADELKSGGSTSQRYTAEMTLKIGVEMHLQPLSYDFESIAEQICQQYPALTYEDLLKMARHLVIDTENAEEVLLNQVNCLRFAELTVDCDWSPKKLESEIKKSLGIRAGGRPRKAR